MSEFYYVNRDAEQDAREGVAAYDEAFFKRFGRYPDDSTHRPEDTPGSTAAAPRSASPRRQAILNLIERGATEGEREAARAALERIDGEQADEDDYLDALYHGAA